MEYCAEIGTGLTLEAGTCPERLWRNVGTPSNSSARTPHLVPGVDHRSLPIGPSEAFVLSRIDGRTPQNQLAAATGLAEDVVAQAVDRLIALGAASLGERETRVTPSAPPTAPLYDSAELREPCDLDANQKHDLLTLYYRLPQIDHYELLGLDPAADKKTVKDAYFRIVSLYHPDRFFGKNLGAFRPKIEKIFARLTEAHDALTRKRTRHEYDTYLATKRRSAELERFLRNGGEVGDREPESRTARVTPREDSVSRRGTDPRAEPEPDDERLASSHFETELPPDVGPAGVEGQEPASNAEDGEPRGNEESGTRARGIPAFADARRRALARRMRRGSAPPPPPTTRSSRPPAEARQQVADELKRLYSARLGRTRDTQVESYVTAAQVALDEKDPVSAANALRIAAALDPENTNVRERLEHAERAAHVKLADSFLEQAQYEEQEQHWEEAARSYLRAALGKPSARVHERAAFCLLQSGGDMKVASEHAKLAVQLAPNLVSTRVTLAQVYLRAGMRQSALAELERAQAIAPHDDNIKGWIKRLRRNQV